METRFTHWAMQRAIATLVAFTDHVTIVVDPMTPEQSMGMELGKHEEERLQVKVRRSLKRTVRDRD